MEPIVFDFPVSEFHWKPSILWLSVGLLVFILGIMGIRRAARVPSEQAYWIIGFALFLALTNWQLERTLERSISDGASQSQVFSCDFSFPGLLLAICAALYFAWLIFRRLLDLPGRVPRSYRLFGDWRWLLLLAPLWFHTSTRSFTLVEDDGLLTTISGYGTVSSTQTFLFAAASILLLQTYHRLEAWGESSGTLDPEKTDAAG